MKKKKISPQKKAIRTVAIVVKRHVPEAQKLALEAMAWLQKRKIITIDASKEVKSDPIQKADLILVFGGDGTFISAARRVAEYGIPILGINMGQLGFLTEIKKTELIATLTKALKGKLRVDIRSMLECKVTRNGKTILKSLVVNDVVVSRGAIARIFDMEVLVDGKLVTNIKADGIIVATPTGSTAYGLAAGGPIVVPNVPSMAIVPICPHSLTLRPLILSENSLVSIVPQSKNGTIILTLDGQSSTALRSGDIIRIVKSKRHSLCIMSSAMRDYFSLLREKLKYGYRD